jgi:eukaryotic-like serine/threonine-protein kinase
VTDTQVIDTILNERYLILKSLGKGGFSETFLAQDDLSSALRVVKRLKLSSTPSETAQELFETEVQTLYQLGHLNQQIPALFDHFVEDQSLYLVQEFIDGPNLAQETEKGQTWNQEKIIELLRQVLPALQFLHSHQVIHGDIKPRNIIRRKDGRLALIDFGAVKLASSQSTSSAQSSPSAQSVVVGTAGYMPNEQQTGRSRFSSDIYALGMIAIQCITGIHPRDLKEDPKTGEIQWKSQVKLHPKLARIVGKMVKVRLRERYTSASAVLVDLDRFEQGQTSNQLPAQIIYGSVICLLLLGGLIGVQRPADISRSPPAPRSSSHPPIALQIIGISIPIATFAALTRLRLW